jgi:beta-galactosidase GanA
MARWVGVVVDKIRPQLATAGGNVILLQVENEYSGGGGAGGNDQDYLDWCVDMGRNLTTDVPWILCHDIL